MKSPLLPDSTYRSILCVVDFSDPSLQELKWAIPEAQRHRFHISVLHPYRLNQHRKKEHVVQSKKDMDRVAVSAFERLAEGLLREHKVSFDFRSEVGFILDRIQEYASKNKVAMLVMGKKMVLDNADSLQELIESINVPIVIVPEES